MRSILAVGALLTAVMLVLGGAQAGDTAKKVTLKGTVTCAKCDLGKTDKCATVIVTKDAGKDTIYFFDTASNKKYHGEVCQQPKEGTVMGTVMDKDGKKVVAVSSIDLK